MTEFDLEQTDKLLTTTRAVRKRLDLEREVPHDLIMDCIRIATQAPAGGNFQRWRWMVIDDPAKKLVIADAYRRAYAPYIEARKAADSGHNPTGERILSSSDHLAEILEHVPIHVLPCAIGSPEDEGSGLGQGWWGSLLPAVWSFMLAARSRGLGTAWTTLHLHFADEVAEALEMPPNVTQAALVPTAFYTGETFRPGDRLPAEKVTYFNTWKNTAS